MSKYRNLNFYQPPGKYYRMMLGADSITPMILDNEMSSSSIDPKK